MMPRICFTTSWGLELRGVKRNQPRVDHDGGSVFPGLLCKSELKSRRIKKSEAASTLHGGKTPFRINQAHGLIFRGLSVANIKIQT